MNTEQLLKSWQKQRTEFEINPSFSENVLKKINEHNTERMSFDLSNTFEKLGTWFFVKAGLITTAALAGLVRIAWTIQAMISEGAFVS